jgi:hypothetical protein
MLTVLGDLQWFVHPGGSVICTPLTDLVVACSPIRGARHIFTTLLGVRLSQGRGVGEASHQERKLEGQIREEPHKRDVDRSLRSDK